MQYKAFLLAQKWVLSNYRVYRKTGVMWEKYDVIETSPNMGSGGEYAVQVSKRVIPITKKSVGWIWVD